jgi:aryl-phospho-beta-D-glucosidase BglC (GH1 family)
MKSGRGPFSLITRRQFAGVAAAAGVVAAANPALARHHYHGYPDRGGAGFSGGGGIGYRRGINIYHMMREPRRQPDGQFPWPPYADALHQMSDAEIATLRQIGFDFVRIAITPDIFSIVTGHQSDALYAILSQTIERFLRVGIKVIADFHPVASDNPGYTMSELVADENGPAFDGYLGTVERFARALTALPQDMVSFDLMNEPPLGGRNRSRWQPMMERLHGAARQAAPDLLIVLTGAQGAPDALMDVDPAPFSGSNVAYSFHYYEPHTFTHQGVAPARANLTAIPWPSSTATEDETISRVNAFIDHKPGMRDDEKTTAKANADSTVNAYFSTGAGPGDIVSALGSIANWGDSNGIPRERILMTEFGVVRTVGHSQGAAEADRLRWLQTVRQAAEDRRFGWALWSYSGPGGMTLANEYPARTLDNATLKALGLRPVGNGT